MRALGVRLLVVASVLVVGTVIGGIAGGLYLNVSPASADQVVFTVRPGETFGAVATRLAQGGVVRSPLLMRALARVRGADERIRAGHYSIPPGTPASSVLDLLVDGHQEQVRVTIPEGWTIRRIGDLLEERGITSAEAFREAVHDRSLIREYGIRGTTLEGYLFPDTYQFPRSYPAVAVARSMLDNFYRRLARVHDGFESMDPDEFHETVILASIVEREYQRPEEAALIASVFRNRLAVNVGLESCATVAYVLTELEGKEHPEVITHQDLQLDSAFNTYKWHGLPPGPISNPGGVALDAAFFPAQSDYWYFVLKDPSTGEHYFSRDLDEHNDAKFFFLKGVTS